MGRKPTDLSSPRCTVCRHEHRWRIELLRAGGASLDALANKFGVERDAIWRHWHNHVSPEAKASFLAGPIQLEELAKRAAQEGESTLDYLKIVRGSLLAQLGTLGAAGDARNVAYVCSSLTRTLETIARISGELGAMAGTINVGTVNVAMLAEHPAFARAQAAILRALQPHPEARLAVIGALRALDEGNAPAATASPANGHGKLLELEATHVG
jgi:hypothetical protein